MTAPVFGTIDQRYDDEPLPTTGVDFSAIGLVSTAIGADEDVFPANEPIRFNSSDVAKLAALGTGYLADAVRGINAQLAAAQRAADVTVVRVPEGASSVPATRLDQTFASLITGLGVLKRAPAQINKTPRLVAVPGYTAQRNGTEANPVVSALPEVLNALLAVSVVDVDDGTMAAAISGRETIGSERIMPVGVAARVFDVDGATVVTRPMAPRVLGLFNRVDFQSGGKPFETIANRQVYGIVDTSRSIAFDLRDGACEGQQMLAEEVSIVVRGEVETDGAVADGGFVFIGLDNCATDGSLWQQIHQVRGQDCIDVEHLRLTRQFLGPKISAATAEAWINSLKFNLRDHKAADDILGFEVKFVPDNNSPENIRAGRLTIDLGIEEAPAFRVAKRNVRRYRQAVSDLVANIAATVNSNAAA